MIVCFPFTDPLPRALAQKCIDSIKATMPDMNVHIWTNKSTACFPGCSHVQRDFDDFMEWRLSCLAECCYRQAVYIDYDVIVQKSLRHVFELDFDVALTVRDHRDRSAADHVKARTPHNAGVMFSRGAGGQQFYREVLEQYRAIRAAGAQDAWMSGQDALENAFRQTSQRVIEIPAYHYNYTPTSPDEDVSHAHCVHYKGPRKSWIVGDAAAFADDEVARRMHLDAMRRGANV